MALPRAATAALTAAVIFLLCASVVPGAARSGPPQPKAERWWAYVGTYTGKESKGIYRFDFDPSTGKLSGRALAAEVVNPSFLAVHPNQRFLYAVGELGRFGGKKGGAVSAFAIDAKTGDLKLLNQQSSVGAGPCHLVADRQGKHVLAANYAGGSVCVLPVGADGRLGEASAFVQHKGRGPNKQRQEAPHAHSVNLDAANRFAFVADLGLDQVLIYRYDAARGTLTPNDPPAVAVSPGSGPRHFAFHPIGKNAYVINELTSTVTALAYDPDRGALRPLQTVTTLPEGFKGKNSTAEVVVHPSGRFVYGSNRGHNSIAVYTVDPKTGELTPGGHQAEGIQTPRNFVIDPTGAFLVVANQGSGSLVVFRIDRATGALTPTGHRVDVPAPVCVRFVPRP
jgi:6-phosphogluconolactonase